MGPKTLLFLAVLAGGSSTCQGKSAGGGPDVTKEPEKAASADVTLEGIDTSSLTPREKKEWSTYVSELLAPCPSVAVPVAQCVKEKRDCGSCLPAARFLARGVRDGLSREQVEKAYKNRFDPAAVKEVPLDGSPTKGPEGAPVTVVEFADFECPYCAQVAPMLDKTFESLEGKARFVYKFYPLPGHPHADPAARAAIAAGNQGNFWEMHKKLFANRDHLEPRDLEAYAKELGLDVAKLRADMASKETTDRIARDKKLGEKLEIGGTPTIFVNGRLFDVRADLNEWIALELDVGARGGAKPAPAQAAAADAGPVADAGAAKADAAPAKSDAGR